MKRSRRMPAYPGKTHGAYRAGVGVSVGRDEQKEEIKRPGDECNQIAKRIEASSQKEHGHVKSGLMGRNPPRGERKKTENSCQQHDVPSTAHDRVPSTCKPMPPFNFAVTSATSVMHNNGQVICGAGMKRRFLFIARCSTEIPRLNASMGSHADGLPGRKKMVTGRFQLNTSRG